MEEWYGVTNVPEMTLTKSNEDNMFDTYTWNYNDRKYMFTILEIDEHVNPLGDSNVFVKRKGKSTSLDHIMLFVTVLASMGRYRYPRSMFNATKELLYNVDLDPIGDSEPEGILMLPESLFAVTPP